MNMNEFKLHTGKWGFMAQEIADESLGQESLEVTAKHLYQIFKKRADLEGARLVEGSLHTYNDLDKNLFGFSERDGFTTFVVYCVPR